MTVPMLAAGLLLLPSEPAGASSNVGGGEAAGTVSFTNIGGVPPLFSPCAATSFNLSGSAEAFALNTVITGYAGPVTLSGSGASTCETAASGGGGFNLNVSGTGPTGSTISCTGLSGTFLRVLTNVEALLSGSCVVNNFRASVQFFFEGEFTPSGTTGAGVTSPIYAANFQGAFAVIPA